MTQHEKKPESAELRTQEDQYNDPRFKREPAYEVHVATGCKVTLYAEERPTGLAQCSTYDRWVGHWSTPNWHYPVTRFVSVEEMERAVSEAEARGAAEQRRKDEPEFEKIVAERDDAEDFIRKMAEIVLGEAVEWSNVYGFQNALDEVSERIYLLEKKAANVAALEARVKELEGCEKDAARFRWLVENVGLYYGIPGFAAERGRSPEKRIGDLLRAIDANIARSAADAAIREGGEHG